MNIQDTWMKKRRVVVYRLMGTLKCRVLHMQMTKVVKQNKMIPKVPRFVGSPSHKYGGLLGEVVLTAGLLICFVDQSRR